ncbi:Uncharacterised protein [Burkholderia pseudomallei]|nr:Uncharacterised protein [Burkholderia pseudomallei]VBP10953.1 Uncharacterised protein [Burkholderia pseudomallei]
MVRARAKRFRQAGEADRRLEPFAVRPALDVIENLGPVHDGHRIVEREDLGARRRSDLARPVPQSRCRGTGDVRARGRRRRRRAAAPRRQSAENPLPFDSSITTRPAPAIPHRKKREYRRSSHLVRHPTYPMPECGATHAPCHAQRPPRRSGRELASHIPPAAAHSRARHRHLAKRPACRCEPVFSVSGRSEMNRLKRILNDQTIRENRASQARPRKENHLDGVPPDKGK